MTALFKLKYLLFLKGRIMNRRLPWNRTTVLLLILLISGLALAGNRNQLPSLQTGKAAHSDKTLTQKNAHKFKKLNINSNPISGDSQDHLRQSLEQMKMQLPAQKSNPAPMGKASNTGLLQSLLSKKKSVSVRTALNRFQRTGNTVDPYVDSIWHDEDSDQVIFVRFEDMENLQKSSPMTLAAMHELALSALENHPALFQLEAPREELRLLKHEADDLGFTHLRYEQTYHSLNIRGSELVVHIHPCGYISAINGRYQKTPSYLNALDYEVSGEEAVASAFDDLGLSFTQAGQPVVKKTIYTDANTKPCLAWCVELEFQPFLKYTFYIHGQSGTILNKDDHVRTDGSVIGSAKDLLGMTRSINLYQAGSKYYMIDLTKDMFPGWDGSDDPDGALMVFNCNGVPFEDETTGEHNPDFGFYRSNSTQKNQWRQDEVSASYFISACYDYYRQTHGRKGLDNQAMPCWVLVNTDWDNACHMSGTQYFIFGNGNASTYSTIRALDVLAHEYGHGVTAFSSRLEYEFQSGALNEAYSDYSGIVVEHYVKSNGNWMMGEDMMRASSGYTCIRDVGNPHNSKAMCQHPETMSEYENLSMDQDRGGVHVNCTIPAHAIYLISQSIGFQNMETLMYRTFTQYMVPLAQFVDFRLATVQAAEDLGFSSTQINQIKQAFDDVEIYDGSGSSAPDPYQPVSGDDFVIGVYSNDGQMLRLDAEMPYSSDKVTWLDAYTENKPSITEDGSVVVYIDLDGQLCLYYPDTGNSSVIESPGLTWHNVAISPKGDYLALIPDREQFPSTLIIWDLNSGDQSIRTLTVPSQTQGTEFTADYADILDWTNDGGYLVYDCCVTLPGDDYGDYASWNICLTSAASEKYGVLLSAGNNLIYGNPCISSVRDYVIAFDVLDFSNGASDPAYYMATYDMSSGTFGIVAQNDNIYGHPSFSPDDSKVVFQDRNSSDEFFLSQINLKSDKLNGDANSKETWIKPVQFPVWYATGSRPGGGSSSGSKRLIFYEDFDDWGQYDEFPPSQSGWYLSSTDESHTWELFGAAGFDAIDSDDQYSAYVFYNADVSQYETLMSPKIELQGSPMTLEFWVYYSSTWLINYDFYFYLWDGNNVDRLWELEEDGHDYEWHQFIVEIPSKYAYQEIDLNWCYKGQDGYSVGLDGISLYCQTTSADQVSLNPEEFTLRNYPNPFNPSTTIEFDLPITEEVRIVVYNIQGQEMEELVHERMEAGHYQTVWNASAFPSGIYLIRLLSDTRCMTQKCMLVK